MQKSFTTQPELFVSSADLNHPVLHTLDNTEALLDWRQVEHVLSSITGQVNNKLVRLLPGMAVTAEVKTGTRRIIEFFLAPLLRYKEESIRER